MIFVFVSLSKEYGHRKGKHCHCVSIKTRVSAFLLVTAPYASLPVYMCVLSAMEMIP